MYQLDRIAILQADLGYLRPTDNLPVQLYHDHSRVEAELVEQVRDRGRARDPPGFAVHQNEKIAHDSALQGSSSASVAAAESATRHSAEMAATP